MNQRRTKISFGIGRMLLAMSVAALNLRLYGPFGFEGLFAAALVTIGLGGLVLFARRADMVVITRTSLFSAAGLLFAEMMGPGILHLGFGIGHSAIAACIPASIGVSIGALLGSLAYAQDSVSNEDRKE